MKGFPMTEGKRVYFKTWLGLRPGEYLKDDNNIWRACAPNSPYLPIILSKHEVVENGDGTITVTPSILVKGADPKNGNEVSWHGYLTNGIWRDSN